MKTAFLFVLCLINLNALAQKTLFIVDEDAKEPIPFAKVTVDNRAPILADLNGSFTVSNDATIALLQYAGYQDTVVQLTLLSDGANIDMRLSAQQLDPIKVLPGINPAHRIMENAIANRRANHPIKKEAFRYKSYSKFLVDIDPDYIASIPADTDDSMQIQLRELSDTMHLFLMESVSERYFEPPLRDQERILAYKISGLSDPRFSTFAKGIQSFSFYDTQIELLGRSYLNPMALGSLNRYLFSLEDTIINTTDTTFAIYFRPKAKRNFDGVEGYLYINTNGFAIEKVIAEPYDSTDIPIKIVQEYRFVENKKWFPARLSTEIDLSSLFVPSEASEDPQESFPKIFGSGYTIVEEVTFQPEEAKWKESSVTLFADENAGDLTEEEWSEHREKPITDKERNTYTTVDSLAKEVNIDRFVRIADILADGKVPLGYINLDLRRLYRYNFYEKHRLGLGLETSDKLLKPLTVGGYFAYGTGDKEWKYGGYMHFHLWKQKQMRLELSYQKDVLERGGNQFRAASSLWLDPDSYRNLFIRSMDRQQLAEIAFRSDIRANLSVQVAQNYQRLQFTQGYRFIDGDGSEWQQIDAAVASIDLEWNPFAKYQVFGNRKIAKKTPFPKFRLRVDRGWKGFEAAALDFWRFNLSVTQSAKLGRLLTLDWKLNASALDGEAPLIFNHVGDGTRVDWNIATPGSFETMPTAHFYTTRQASVFLRLKFASIHTKAEWNEPQFSLHHAWGIGTFDNRTSHNVFVPSFDKGYSEVGVILDGILVQQFSGFGVGVFYNYSPEFTAAVWHENIVPKISFSFVLD